MKKNYLFSPLRFSLFLTIVGLVNLCWSQEIKIFTIADFDLTGPVKSCLVSTKYGKEAYDFDKEGKLTKSVTRYNDEDYDVTYYKYGNGELVEKRFESYRGNIFDSGTSYANFYVIDTLPVRKITEKIISYEKEFLDQYEYLYNADNVLVKIIRTNNDGNDETLIEYADYKGEQTQTLSLNGTVLKSVRKSTKIAGDKSEQRIVLTKKFLKGEPNTALEEVFDAWGKLISETKFVYGQKKKQFIPDAISSYEYGDMGMLIKSTTKKGKQVDVKEYMYQFDNGGSGNWMKQIITPENSYTTRKIKYHKVEPIKAEVKEK